MLMPEGVLSGILVVLNQTTGGRGTGFAYAMIKEGASSGKVWVVTCAHVVAAGQGQGATMIEINDTEGGIGRGAVEGGWTFSDEWEGWAKEYGQDWWNREKGIYSVRDHLPKDVAVTRLNKAYTADGREIATAATKDAQHSRDAWTRKRIRYEGVSEGHEVLALGYTEGRYEIGENWPVVRRGSIAQITPYKRGLTGSFAVDAGIFEGASGGPVMLLPSFLSRGGSGAIHKGGIIGMACATVYMPMEIRVEIRTTERGSIGVPVSQQHMGLGYVIPIDEIHRVIEKADRNEKK